LEVTLYARFAQTQLGSSALFGGSFFAVTLASDGLAEAAAAGLLAAGSWFAVMPLLRRIIGATAGAR
jgi:hypothetical protein